MFHAAYTLSWLVLLPFAVLRLYWRGRKEPGYRADIGERFARHGGAESFCGAWWVHAVSVGETRAAAPIVEALLSRDDDARILLTVMTPTGRSTAEALYARWGRRVRVAYLPYDLPWLARRFLCRFRPRAGVVMETEIWPNLLAQARLANVPIILANARLSQRSADRYARLGAFAQDVFGALRAVGAQSPADARRLAALGAPEPIVTGSVKFDVAPPADTAQRTAELQALIGERTVVLAASTREGEEEALLDAFVAQACDALLLLVPRHPQRFGTVASLIRSRNLAMQKRSDHEPVRATTRVLLGDSMGEMFAYYSASDVAIIGGSWQPLGGQNLIEACAVGTPVIVGPHTYNFSEITANAIGAKAARRASDCDEAFRIAMALLADPPRLASMASAARSFAQAHQGATRRTLALIDGVLDLGA